MSGCQQVRLVSIPLKGGESALSAKRRILRSIRSSEKREHKTTPISNPLQRWKDLAHILPDVPAQEVVKVVSNACFLVFLLRDGRVCRLPVMSSPAKISRRETSTAVREQGDQSFQVLSDAEYARQLQADMNPRGRRERRLRGRRGEGEQSSFVVVSVEAEHQLPTSSDRWGHSLEVLLPPFHGRDLIPGGIWSESYSNQEVTPTRLPSVSPSTGTTHARTLPEQIGDGTTTTTGGLLGGLHNIPRYHGDQSSTSEGAESGGNKEKPARPWPAIGTLQWTQNDEDGELLFSDVAALHSEILLISRNSRQLYSWTCCDEVSMVPKPHPLIKELGLSLEAIALIESSECRVTMATVSGKLATFYDRLLRECPQSSCPSLIHSLSHPATEFPELQGETLTQLAVSNFISIATTKSERVFWWGLTPRGKKDVSSTPSSGSSAPQQEKKQTGGREQISDGSLVRLKNGPPCGPNAIVLTMSLTHGPQVGKTVSVMERSSIDPKTSILVKVFRNYTRQSSLTSLSSARSNFDAAHPNLSELGDIYSGLEVWKLSDVVFLNDAPSILGRVVAIDKQQAVVDCTHTESPVTEGASGAKSSLKVFRLAELEPCIEGPDFQPTVTSSSMTSSSKSGVLASNTSCSRHLSALGNPISQRTITRHISGTVQHRPVCIVDPAPLSQARKFNSDSIPPSPNRLTGFRPLAVQATDLGPNILVERIVDLTAFLVCSAHLTTAALNVTSFVAIGNHDSKPKHCTIAQEAINSVDAGLVFNPCLTRVINALKNREGVSVEDVAMVTNKSGTRMTGKEALGKKRTLSKKGKTVLSHSIGTQVSACSGSNSIPNGMKCEFIPLSTGHSNLFFIRDCSGSIWPLLDGLCLKCPSSGLSSGPSGLVSRRPQVPLQSYRSVTLRQYYVQGHGDVVIAVLVPHNKVILPAIQNGSTEKVVSTLSNLTPHLTTSLQCHDNTTEANDVVAEPVIGTGKTCFDSEMDTSDSNRPALECIAGDYGGIDGSTTLKPVCDTRKICFDDDSVELTPIAGASDNQSNQLVRRSRRKRRHEFKSEPRTRKKQRSKEEEEEEGGREGGEERGGGGERGEGRGEEGEKEASKKRGRET